MERDRARERRREMSLKKKPKAVIVGGSIAGVSCAHSLILAGWDVLVVEKSYAPPTGSPTGAGLGLDPLSLRLIQSWIKDPDLLHKATLPLTIDQNDAIDGENKVKWTLTRDEDFNCRAAHWADLHALLYNALPPNLFLWGHNFLSFSISSDKSSVIVKASSHRTNEIIEIAGDLLVAADGFHRLLDLCPFDECIVVLLVSQALLAEKGQCNVNGVEGEGLESMGAEGEGFEDVGGILGVECDGLFNLVEGLLRGRGGGGAGIGRLGLGEELVAFSTSSRAC
ncbi:FAD-dependent monooxygenase atmM-like [Pyrus communis]|uniref:FAD-dependent monooxygenase atmM-like n=1 Tax=Pyrus communis TaxID=23211 RepID=UPI0035C19919